MKETESEREEKEEMKEREGAPLFFKRHRRLSGNIAAEIYQQEISRALKCPPLRQSSSAVASQRLASGREKRVLAKASRSHLPPFSVKDLEASFG